MAFHVTLDIQGLLACDKIVTEKDIAFFRNRGAIVSAHKTMYVFPAVIELVAALYQNENTKVAFFTTRYAIKNWQREVSNWSRSEKFVEEIVKKATTEENWLKVKEGKKYVVGSEGFNRDFSYFKVEYKNFKQLFILPSSDSVSYMAPFVEAKEGKGTSFNLKANRIYFVAGMLFAMLDAVEKGCSIEEELAQRFPGRRVSKGQEVIGII